MPLLRINAAARGLCLHGSTQPLHGALAQQPVTPRPTVVMVHGYKYSPVVLGHCPHERLFHDQGWPQALGLAGGRGTTVAFGWHARGGLRRAHARALEQARALAELVCALRGRGPVHLITHSLGATLVLAALPYLRAGDVGRIVVLNGAAHLGLAHHALATPCGQQSRLFHITARENRLFDLGFEAVVTGSGAMGRGLNAPHAVEIQISCARTRAGLAHLGFNLAPPQRPVCHWSSYRRPGVMKLNAALLAGDIGQDQLRAALPSGTSTRHPGWSLALHRKTGIMVGNQTPKGSLYGQAY